MEYDFQRDPAKAKRNLQKYGISFARAARVFLDPLMFSLNDEGHSQSEDRWIT